MTVTFDETPTIAHRPPGLLRRFAAALGLSITAVVVGAVAAIVLATSVAVLVVTLSDLLG